MLGGKNRVSQQTPNEDNISGYTDDQHGNETEDTSADLAKLQSQSESLQQLLKESEQKILQAEAKAKQAQEDHLRVYADFENYKKRSLKEREEIQKFANEGILEALLPLLDGFDQTLQLVKPEGELVKFLEGVEMLRKQFLQILAKFGIEVVASVGKPFDPHMHEAISQEVAVGVASGTVLREWRKGYKLNDRLLRAAMVVVAK